VPSRFNLKNPPDRVLFAGNPGEVLPDTIAAVGLLLRMQIIGPATAHNLDRQLGCPLDEVIGGKARLLLQPLDRNAPEHDWIVMPGETEGAGFAIFPGMGMAAHVVRHLAQVAIQNHRPVQLHLDG